MADDVADLAKLPIQISLLAREVQRAGLALNTASLGRWLDPTPRRAIVALNEVRMGWRLYIARSHSRVVFFFFRQKSPVSVVLDTNIAFRVTTVNRTHPPTLIQADESAYCATGFHQSEPFAVGTRYLRPAWLQTGEFDFLAPWQ
jgi:hypothetical protein